MNSSSSVNGSGYVNEPAQNLDILHMLCREVSAHHTASPLAERLRRMLYPTRFQQYVTSTSQRLCFLLSDIIEKDVGFWLMRDAVQLPQSGCGGRYFPVIFLEAAAHVALLVA